MPPITLESIQAKQTELDALIQQFKSEASKPMLLVLPRTDIELQPGEHYAGTVLNASGHVLHHLVLMSQRPDSKLAWQAACDWADSIDGYLPTRQEQSLLFTNCKPHLKPEWHWSSETYEDDASCAWFCYFSSGDIYGGRKSYEGSAVAVRRIL
jgi:hypothetical protein